MYVTSSASGIFEGCGEAEGYCLVGTVLTSYISLFYCSSHHSPWKEMLLVARDS